MFPEDSIFNRGLTPAAGATYLNQMTKKNYVAVAQVLSKELQNGGDARTLNNIAQSLCTAFAQDNPNFSESAFMKAVGLGGGGLPKGGLSRGSGGFSSPQKDAGIAP